MCQHKCLCLYVLYDKEIRKMRADHHPASVNITIIWLSCIEIIGLSHYRSFVFPSVPRCKSLLRGKSDCRCCNSEHDAVDEPSTL